MFPVSIPAFVAHSVADYVAKVDRTPADGGHLRCRTRLLHLGNRPGVAGLPHGWRWGATVTVAKIQPVVTLTHAVTGATSVSCSIKICIHMRMYIYIYM